MRILFLSDPHFHAYKSHSTLVDGVNSRQIDIENAVEAAFKVGGYDLACITGDFYHVRGYVKPSIQNRVVELFKRLVKPDTNIVAIGGNHDMEHYKYGEMAVEPLNLIDGMRVFTKLGFFNPGSLVVACIPYIHDIKEFKQAFKDLSKDLDENGIVLIHQGIDDFAGAGIPETTITAEWLEKHNPGWTFSGHYHTPNKTGRVVNVGSVCQHSFGDIGKKRGCWVFDTETKEITYHSLLDAAPQFVDYDKKEPGNIKSNFVRAKVDSVRKGRALKKEILKAGAKSVQVTLEKVHVTAHEKTVAVSKPANMISDYIDIHEKYKPRKKDILDLFKEVCSG